MDLHNIIIILCRPSESGNVGAVCRAMKNMGLSRLRIVAPEEPLDDKTIRIRSVWAEDVWDAAEHFDRLSEAIADCGISIGTTRRRGQKRKQRSLDPRELGSFLVPHPGPASIIFGNERTGLTGEEVDLCSMVSHIPVNEDFPSLNLSHAVQLYAWELSQALGPKKQGGPKEADPGSMSGIDRKRQTALVEVFTDTLRVLGFYEKAGRPEQERFFQELLARSGLNRREADYLEKILCKARRLAQQHIEG